MIENILISRDNKGKLRFLKIGISCLEDQTYKIYRFSGQLEGKEIEQPPLYIKVGKVKRTPLQQAELEFNSIVKKAKDKGYKDLSEYTNKPFESVVTSDIDNFVSKTKESQSGLPIPMKAKETTKVKPAVWNKHYKISKKLDGIRCCFYWDQEEEVVKVSSFKGKNLTAALSHITTDPKVVYLFSKKQDLILDGEIYVHGTPLRVINGLANVKEHEDRCDVLEFHCYDVIKLDLCFDKRLEILNNLETYFSYHSSVFILEHLPVYGYEQAKGYHDLWVQQGYEGAILRDGSKDYNPGGRDLRMIKLKEFQDAEFEITGITLGLRGSEDMVFNMKTDKGVAFEAKPLGNRAIKEEYVKIEKDLIGKMATVKFFYFTDAGVPFLPVFKCVREND